jgi:hypothetical protein
VPMKMSFIKGALAAARGVSSQNAQR